MFCCLIVALFRVPTVFFAIGIYVLSSQIVYGSFSCRICTKGIILGKNTTAELINMGRKKRFRVQFSDSNFLNMNQLGFSSRSAVVVSPSTCFYVMWSATTKQSLSNVLFVDINKTKQKVKHYKVTAITIQLVYIVLFPGLYRWGICVTGPLQILLVYPWPIYVSQMKWQFFPPSPLTTFFHSAMG